MFEVVTSGVEVRGSGSGVGKGCWERVLGKGVGKGCWERFERDDDGDLRLMAIPLPLRDSPSHPNQAESIRFDHEFDHGSFEVWVRVLFEV